MKAGDEHEAAGVFEAATRLRADDAEAWANLSIALQAIGEHDRSRKCARQAALLQPSSPDELNARAEAEFVQGRIDEAIEAIGAESHSAFRPST